jgi:hypothetical protein
MNGLNPIYDDNEQSIENDPSKVSILDRTGWINAAPDLQSFRLLGVLLDENLTFDPHINMLLAKLSKSTFIINKVKNILPPQTLRTFYFSLFHFHLTYCPIIASCASKSSVEKIFKAQKKVIRIISNATYNAHTAPLFNKLKIMPYPTIITQSSLHLMHSAHHKYSPSLFHNIWHTNAQRNPNITLRNADDYYNPRANLSLF